MGDFIFLNFVLSRDFTSKFIALLFIINDFLLLFERHRPFKLESSFYKFSVTILETIMTFENKFVNFLQKKCIAVILSTNFPNNKNKRKIIDKNCVSKYKNHNALHFKTLNKQNTI